MTFQTAAPTYLWLNDVLAIGEGTIDVEHATPCHALLRVPG